MTPLLHGGIWWDPHVNSLRRSFREPTSASLPARRTHPHLSRVSLVALLCLHRLLLSFIEWNVQHGVSIRRCIHQYILNIITYIHIRIYVIVSISIHLYLYLCIYLHLHLYLYLYISIHIYIYISILYPLSCNPISIYLHLFLGISIDYWHSYVQGVIFETWSKRTPWRGSSSSWPRLVRLAKPSPRCLRRRGSQTASITRLGSR